MARHRRFLPVSKPVRVGFVLALTVLVGVAAGYFGSTSASAAAWPSANGTTKITATKKITGTFDGGLKRLVGSGDLGSDDQSESQPPLLELADGAVLKNVILGSPAVDGIHCKGSCTLRNVWWEDVGEDAATFRGTSSSTTVLVDGGGARKASDKVFQHNGAGTVTIRNFQVSDFGKLYRSCGNCTKQYKRNVVLQNITVTSPGRTIVGINTNYGDTASLSDITVVDDTRKKIKICERFTGNSSGSEPTSTGSGPAGKYCRYASSDVTYTS